MTRLPVSLLAVIGVILLLQGQPTAAQAVTSKLKVPFVGVVDVPLPDGSTETVPLTGAIHVTSVLAPVDPCRCRIEVNLVGVSGSGDVTGSHYELIGADNVLQPDGPPTAPVEFDFLLVSGGGCATCVPPNPTEPPDPILPLRATLQFAFNGAVLTGVTVGDVTIPDCGDDVCTLP